MSNNIEDLECDYIIITVNDRSRKWLNKSWQSYYDCYENAPFLKKLLTYNFPKISYIWLFKLSLTKTSNVLCLGKSRSISE
jgi:hypothetical protein